MAEEMKTCKGCEQSKPLSEYHIQRGRPRGKCKLCVREYNQEYYKIKQASIKNGRKQKRVDNPEGFREQRRGYYDRNRESIAEKNKLWVQNNRPKVATWQKRYYESNKEKLSEYKKNWAKDNPEKMRSYSKKWASKPEVKAKRAAYAREWRKKKKAEEVAALPATQEGEGRELAVA